MEIKIAIDSSNKERVLALVSQLVDAESEARVGASIASNMNVADAIPVISTMHDRLDACFRNSTISLSPPEIATSPFGAWAMFNSFIPGKAAMRVLGHFLDDQNDSLFQFGSLIEETVRSIRSRKFSGVRGFPGSRKASSVPRFATHLVLPLSEMGLVLSKQQNGTRMMGLTEAGLNFSLLENPLLDSQDGKEGLSRDEREWIIGHLKRIDGLGFREYSTLHSIVDYVGSQRPSREQLVDWFANRRDFRDHIGSVSRHASDPPRLRKQIRNLANTYVSSKIAILRELGVVSDVRGAYDLVSKL